LTFLRRFRVIKLSSGHANVQVMHTCLGETQLLAALNCSIVGLASSRCQPASTSDTEGKEQFRLLPCLGFGIVRSVDAGKGMLYILTDVEAAGLEKIDVIQVLPSLRCWA
jgi:hypothetical protein